MRTPTETAILVGPNGYHSRDDQDNSVLPYNSLSDPLAAYPAQPVVPQRQDRAGNTKKRSEKKYRRAHCGIGCSQSQVLSRHIRDKHETKKLCLFCSFTWSRGRPHLYKEHLKVRHPRIAPSEVQQIRLVPSAKGIPRRQASKTMRNTHSKWFSPLPLRLLALNDHMINSKPSSKQIISCVGKPHAPADR